MATFITTLLLTASGKGDWEIHADWQDGVTDDHQAGCVVRYHEREARQHMVDRPAPQWRIVTMKTDGAITIPTAAHHAMEAIATEEIKLAQERREWLADRKEMVS